MTRVRGSELRENRKDVISDEELADMLEKASKIDNKFLRLRARALVSLLRLVGKRRGEVPLLELSDFEFLKTHFNIVFTLLKKRKKTVITKRSTPKTIYYKDPLSKNIIEYVEYLRSLNPTPRYFLPRAKRLFGGPLIILPDKHITGRQVFNIIRDLSDEIWPHLFRETSAADVIKRDPSLFGAYRVRRRLDLESIQTGFRYLDRFASDIIQREGVEQEEETPEESH